MPTIIRLSATLVISINADDHAPPHFHVMGPEVDFTVRLDTLQILAGTANRKALREVIAWASTNMDLLTRKWDEYNERD